MVNFLEIFFSYFGLYGFSFFVVYPIFIIEYLIHSIFGQEMIIFQYLGYFIDNYGFYAKVIGSCLIILFIYFVLAKPIVKIIQKYRYEK